MKRKLDMMTVLGWIGAIACVFFGTTMVKDPISGGVVIIPANAANFYDLTSLAVVVGGTFTALMMSFPLDSLSKIPKHFKLLFMPQTFVPTNYITLPRKPGSTVC
jgi:chemotaxis protein MotA